MVKKELLNFISGVDPFLQLPLSSGVPRVTQALQGWAAGLRNLGISLDFHPQQLGSGVLGMSLDFHPRFSPPEHKLPVCVPCSWLKVVASPKVL